MSEFPGVYAIVSEHTTHLTGNPDGKGGIAWEFHPCECDECVCDDDVDAIIEDRAQQDNQTADFDLKWDVK